MPTVPTVTNAMGGKASIEINGVTIPSFMLGEITPNVAPKTRTSDRLSGSTTRPSGTLDNPTYDVVFFPNDWQDIAHFMPEVYNAPSAPQLLGNIILGGGTCTTPVAVPVNIHYECEGTDDRDTYLTACYVSVELNQAFTETDDMSVMIHIYPQPSTSGQIRLGTGDLTQPSIYDASTSSTVPVAS